MTPTPTTGKVNILEVVEAAIIVFCIIQILTLMFLGIIPQSVAFSMIAGLGGYLMGVIKQLATMTYRESINSTKVLTILDDGRLQGPPTRV